jgi:negative regulator of flagellin synthesis FlgM
MEVGLSYLNGIGSPQQAFNATEAAALANTSSAAKTEKSAALVPGAVEDGAGSASAFDRASLSANAVLMAQALSGSDVRTDKVAALQQSIAAGTYNVSSSDVADKMISALLR